MTAPLNGFVAFTKPAPSLPPMENEKAFPLEPSWIWDKPTREIEWCSISPLSKFGIGARRLGLRHRILSDKTMLVRTTQEELALLIIWGWDN